MSGKHRTSRPGFRGLPNPTRLSSPTARAARSAACSTSPTSARKTFAGFAEPQHAWRVIGESGVLSRFEALRTGTAPLVGREEEFERLMRRWARAKAGEGQVVLLSGEPGIGKSRLTASVLEQLEQEPHTRLRYFCSPHFRDSALWPVIAQLERAAGFERDDTASGQTGKAAGGDGARQRGIRATSRC